MIQTAELPPKEKPTVAAPDAKVEQTNRNSGDLSSSASLSGVDHKTFTDAQRAHSGDTASSVLPEVPLPVALDKAVMSEHEKLSALADSKLGNSEDRQKFKSNMDAFEKRADSQNLTGDQVASAYKQMERILGASEKSPFSSEQRQELAGQWMDRLGNPTSSTRQGWHDTCGWTFLESRLAAKDPEKITEKLADVVTTGGVTTYNWAEIKKLGAAGSTSTVMPTKLLMLDKDSLKPDQEAQGISPHLDRRDYVDQIAQVMEDNMAWDAKTHAPSGKVVPFGSLHYDQCPIIERPSDVLANGARGDKSCESVSYTDPRTHKLVVNDGQGYGFGGAADSTDLMMVNAAITGRFEPIAIQRATKTTIIDHNTALEAGSADELKNQLSGLKQAGQLPYGIFVNAANPGIREDYLARHPEKTESQVPTEAWHIIAVTDVDSKGNAEIFNPWGVKKTLTPEQLYKAMGNPVTSASDPAR